MQDIASLKHDYLQTFNCAKEYFGIESQELRDEIQNNVDKIYDSVLKKTVKYCEENRVYIKNFDDYKVVYFLALEMQKLTCNKNYMLAMLKILDVLVEKDSKHYVNEDMVQKIMLHIEEETWYEKYGEYGIYSIFKACSKHFL